MGWSDGYTISLIFIYLIQGACKKTNTIQHPNYPSSDSIRLGAWYYGGWSFPADSKGYTFQISPSLVTKFSEREPIWGWREDPPGVMESQIDYAANGGLSFWGFCWYENSLLSDSITMNNLNNALDNFLQSPNKNRLDFFLISCNPVSNVSWSKVCNRTIVYFKEPNYLKVDGKPIMTFFNADEIISDLGGISNTKNAIDLYRQRARNSGVGEILIGSATSPNLDQSKYAKCGFDFLFAYNNANYGRINAGANDYSNLETGELRIWNNISSETSLPFIATVGTGYDMRPWATDHPTLPASDFWYTGVTPAKIGAHLRSGLQWTKNNSQKVLDNLLFIYAWNENGEGSWLTPTKSEANARLDTIQNVISKELNK